MRDFRNKPLLRPAVITAFVRQLPDTLGRTGIMKLMYFIQVLRSINLGYSFRIYTYGPYDGQVLEDLEHAEMLQAVNSKVFKWAGGSGYVLSGGEQAEKLMSRQATDLAAISDDLEWVVTKFGKRSAADLEVISTIVFVDRNSSPESLSQLANAVHEIKPHHNLEKITDEAKRLANEGLLQLKLSNVH